MSLEWSTLRVLIVAPVGRDGRLIEDALLAAGMRAESLPTVQEAIDRLTGTDVGALLVTEEVMDATGWPC